MSDQHSFTPEDSRRIRGVLEQALPEWENRVRKSPVVHPGSSLDGDVQVSPDGANAASLNMTVAVDHLSVLRELWLKAGVVHAFADATLLRAALLAASTAVYLLDDSPGVTRQERIRRGALTALSDHRDHRRHQQGLAELTKLLGEQSVAAHTSLLEQLQALETHADSVAGEAGANKEQRRKGLVATECIVLAGRVTARHETGQTRLLIESGIRAVWQKGSADAHGRSWQTMIRVRSRDNDPRLSASVSEVVTGLHTAALVLGQAWRIWDLRSVQYLH